MTRDEALETFTDNEFLYGYSDDSKEIDKDTIVYIINSIYDDLEKDIF